MEDQKSAAPPALRQGSGEAGTASLQEQMLLVFSALHFRFASCQRKLVFCCTEDQLATAAALATTGLGGACLLLDADRGRLRAAGQVGATDFTVNDLSEALRILKNELRKGAAVSIGLAGLPADHVSQLLRRGCQPDVVCTAGTQVQLLQPFHELGADWLLLPGTLPQLAAVRIQCNQAGSMAERRELDRQMLQELAAPDRGSAALRDGVNRAWLKVAARLLPRERTRVHWV